MSKRYGSRRSTIQTHDDYGTRLGEFVDTVTALSPLAPMAESLLYEEEYPVTPFASPRDRMANLLEEPEYQEMLIAGGETAGGLPVGALGTVIGMRAKNFPADLGRRFEEVEADALRRFSADPYIPRSDVAKEANREAFLETGVYRGPDGKLRYEVDDSTSTYLGGTVGAPYLSSDVLLHPQLYDNYEGLGDLSVQGAHLPSNARGVHFRGASPDDGKIALAADVFTDSDEGRSILLHELQHNIQQREGFDVGGSQDRMRKVANDLIRKKQDLVDKSKVSEYKAFEHKLGSLSRLENIASLQKLQNAESPRPSLLTKRSDFYESANEIRRTLGAMPKRGEARSQWIRDAAKILKEKAEQDLKGYNTLNVYSTDTDASDLLRDPKRIKSEIKKARRQIEELEPFNQADKEFWRFYEKFSPMSSGQLYQRAGGEAEARMVQKRRDYSPSERAARFPLDDYDVPLDEILPTGLLDE